MQFALENIFGAVEMLGGEIKVKDLRLELEDKKDDLATVVATGGTLELTVADETQVYVIEEIEPVKVIKKDGTWVICDEALITTGPVNFISINLPEACLGSFLTVYMVALMLVMTLLFWALPRLYRRPFAQEIRQIWKQHK